MTKTISEATGLPIQTGVPSDAYRTGWDGLFKDRVKLGVSPSTEVTNIDCRPKVTTINSAYLNSIQKDSEFLECLDACGVCDWEGYKEAVTMYEEEQEQNR